MTYKAMIVLIPPSCGGIAIPVDKIKLLEHVQSWTRKFTPDGFVYELVNKAPELVYLSAEQVSAAHMTKQILGENS